MRKAKTLARSIADALYEERGAVRRIYSEEVARGANDLGGELVTAYVDRRLANRYGRLIAAHIEGGSK